MAEEAPTLTVTINDASEPIIIDPEPNPPKNVKKTGDNANAIIDKTASDSSKD